MRDHGRTETPVVPPFQAILRAASPAIQHLLTNSVAGPRPRFVLRLCIRKAGEACGEAALGDGPADTRFLCVVLSDVVSLIQ